MGLSYFVLDGLPKSAKKNKQQTNNSDLCLLSSLSMCLNVLFFWAFFGFGWFAKKCSKNKTKGSDLCLLSSLSMGLKWSELFVVVWFWLVCQKCSKTKNKKFRPMSPVQLLHGSELFVFLGLVCQKVLKNKK